MTNGLITHISLISHCSFKGTLSCCCQRAKSAKSELSTRRGLELLPTGDLARRTVAIARTTRHVFWRLLYGDRDLSAIAAREVDDLDRGPWPWTVIEDRRRLLDAWGEATAPDLAITRALALGDTVERLILIYLHAEPSERVLRLRKECRNLELLLEDAGVDHD